MKLLGRITELVLIILLASCATDTQRPDIRERLLEMNFEMGESNSRIPSHRVNGWTSIDENYLIVTSGVNDKYLIELFSPCFGLTSAFYIGFTTPNFGINRFDNLIVRGIDRRRETCPIRDITRLYEIDG